MKQITPSLFGDARLGKVYHKLTEAMSGKLSVSFGNLAEDSACLSQYKRFMKNKRVELESILNDMQANFRSACPSSGHLLLIEDSSQIAFSLNRQVQGLGSVGRGSRQGFYIHPVLALDANNGACYGIAGMEFIHREFEEEKLSRQEAKNQARQICYEQKEGYRWYSAIEASLNYCPAEVSKTVVADREGDIYPLLVSLKRDLGADYLIRSQHDRRLSNQSKLWSEARSWSSVASFSKKLPATQKRLAHTALLEVSYGEVVIKKPKGKAEMELPSSWKTHLVRVWESPETVIGESVEWFLLTSHPVNSPEDAFQIIDWYIERWNVEQVFRILKKRGLNVEDSRLRSYERLQKMVILALIAAVKVLCLLRAREGNTSQKLKGIFTEEEQEMLRIVNKNVQGKTQKQKNPHPPDSLAFAAWVIARLGGWKGYKSESPPGPISFLRGLRDFESQMRAFRMLKKELKGSKDL